MMEKDKKHNFQYKIEEAMELLVKTKSSFVAPELKEEFITEAYHILFQLREEINLDNKVEQIC